MLMMRTLLATVCCIFGSWGLVIELNFGSDFEHKVWSRFWSWSSGKIFELEFGQHFAAGNDICRVMKLNLGCDTLVSWTQPSGPLCLRQCFVNACFPRKKEEESLLVASTSDPMHYICSTLSTDPSPLLHWHDNATSNIHPQGSPNINLDRKKSFNAPLRTLKLL